MVYTACTCTCSYALIVSCIEAALEMLSVYKILVVISFALTETEPNNEFDTLNSRDCQALLYNIAQASDN